MALLSNVAKRVLGHPWVFEHVRPLVVGGIDMSPAYRRLRTDTRSVVVDIGCGMGDALRYLHPFAGYHGFDTDEVAIRTARRRYADRRGVRFECRPCTGDDLRAVGATHVAMIGLLHHLDDRDATELLRMIGQTESVVRAVSLDIVFLPGRPYNNLLARFDRGRYCRTMAEYRALGEAAGLRRVDDRCNRSHPRRGLVEYFVMEFARPA